MRKVEDCTGQKFGKLTVIKEVRDKRNFIYYLCQCECGNRKTVYRSNLISGKTNSCGCLYLTSNQQFRKENEYIINAEKGIVIGKTTNTQAEFIIDLEDYEKVKNISWHESSIGYIMHKDKTTVTLLHRFITDAPRDKVVDHINRNPKDNRKGNLRICTQKDNVYNRQIKSRGKSGEFGITISKNGKKDYYCVVIGGKYRGGYKSLDDAKKCRDFYLKQFYKNYL